MKKLNRVEIHLYRNCNLKCKMCDFKDYTDEIPNINQMSQVITQLKDMNVKIVHFTGGEVLLHPNVNELFSSVYKSGMKIHITTNGVLLNNDLKRDAVAKYVSKLQISIDHYKSDIHNMLRGGNETLENILTGVRKLKEENQNIQLTMNTVISKCNIDSVINLLNLCKEYGFSEFNPIPIKCYDEILPSREQIENLLENEEEIRKKADEINIRITSPNFHIFNVEQDKDAYNNILYKEGCKLLDNQIFINMTTGEVLPCPMTMYRNKDKVLLGNIYDSSLSEIWNSTRTDEVRKFFGDVNSEAKKICYDFCDPAFCYNQLHIKNN